MIELPDLKREITRAKKIDDKTYRKLFVVGIITSETKKHGFVPVIVGGSAVEFYTSGVYQSPDIDLIAKRRVLADLLESLGFEKVNRHWYSPDIDISIECVGSSLAGLSEERLLKVKIGRYTVYTIGVEDLIIDRLNACIYWDSESDCEQSMALLSAYGDEIDYRYLEEKARKEHVLRALHRLRRGELMGWWLKRRSLKT